MHKIKQYGWKRGLPVYGHPTFEKTSVAATPMRADISDGMPAVYDQGYLGSCTANAGGALGQFLNKKFGFKDYLPARLAIYYWTRELEGTVSEDSGASLTDTMRTLADKGMPNEANWPYDISKFTKTPTSRVAVNGKQHLVLDTLQVNQNMDDIRACVAFGFPVVFGFTVYESFESDAVAKTGVVPMPKHGEQVLGGHAVTIVGYDDYAKTIKCRNSWGPAWGQKGYFTMPYDYVENPQLADDFWTAHKITGWRPPKGITTKVNL